jgi:hypothetical protein
VGNNVNKTSSQEAQVGCLDAPPITSHHLIKGQQNDLSLCLYSSNQPPPAHFDRHNHQISKRPNRLTMQFKSLFLASLAALAFADDTSKSTDSSTAMSSRTDTDSKMSHSTSAASAASSHSKDDRSSSDRSDSTHVAVGYALTTDASGSTIATYTGTDTGKPRTAALAAATSSDHSSSSSSKSSSDRSSSTTGSSSGSSTSSHNQAKATAIPLIGAAAMAGIAFVI